MRKLNGALLLDLIRDRGPLSRAELARLSGLTKPTVSSQIADLLRRGVVVEDDKVEPESSGGKPARPLRFNAGCGSIIGAEIGPTRIRIALADLNGTIVDRVEPPAHPEHGAAKVLAALERGIEKLVSRRGRQRGELTAIAVAAPGRIDARRGTVLDVGNVFHWQEVEIGSRLRQVFRVPIAVDNDVNLAALGEMYHGVARGTLNFALLRWTTGVGAGLVVEGRLYQGSHWAAGEIGHMLLDRAALDSREERGHLESAIGVDRVRERARLENGSAAHGLARRLAEALERKDPLAASVLEDVALHVGMATANLAAVLDPELIVLDGDLFQLVMDPIRRVVARTIPWPVRVEGSTLGDEGVLLGALSVARGMAHDLLAGRLHKTDRSEVSHRRT
jgi:predicted NBD/HSP70 family sugar kinase